jgi:DNA polymerase-3 subunit epsilon
MQREVKYLIFDCETTGLDSNEDEIFQLSCSYFRTFEGKLIAEDSLELWMKPHANVRISADAASRMNDIRLLSGCTQEEGFKKFLEFLGSKVENYNKDDKMFLVGYNIPFDEEFIRAWFLSNGNNYYGSYFWYPSIDVAVLAAIKLMQTGTRHELKNFKLGTVAQRFGIQINEAHLHDSGYDVSVTKRLFTVVSSLITR